MYSNAYAAEETYGKDFYIMGKSSSGKDSIYRQLEGDQELGLKRLVIYTTRPIRDGEVNGREYFLRMRIN